LAAIEEPTSVVVYTAGGTRPPAGEDNLSRDLADYDAAFDVAIDPTEWVA
jgi:hypothetical protein